VTALRNLVRVLRVLGRAREHRLTLVRLLARRPALLVGTGVAEFAALLSNRVSPQLKLLAECRVAAIVGCEYCMDIGSALAEYDRLDPRQVVEMNEFEASEAFSEDERLVLRLATALSDRTPTVPDDLRSALGERFTTAQLVELAAAIAHEHERSRFYVGVNLPPSRFASDTACQVPRAV
jgi:alkylhydroperoxidase family enzyme